MLHTFQQENPYKICAFRRTILISSSQAIGQFQTFLTVHEFTLNQCLSSSICLYFCKQLECQAKKLLIMLFWPFYAIFDL